MPRCARLPICGASFPTAFSSSVRPRRAARTIGPQAFTVTGVEYDEQAEGAAGGFGSITYLNLQSGPQPGPQRLACMLPGEAAAPRFLTPAEISGALGGYFNLTVAP